MNKELIEKLKKPELAQPMGLLTSEEQVILSKAGRGNCLFFDDCCEWQEPTGVRLFLCSTYILKPGYEPTPKYIEIEIETNDNSGMCVLKENVPDGEYKMLSCVVSHKDFVCFHDPFGKETTNAGDVPGWMRILAAQDGDIKMYARFEKP